MIYHVRLIDDDTKLSADWRSPAWLSAEPLDLTHHMGDPPAHRPRTQAKLLYDSDAIRVIFRVADRFVRAVAEKFHDKVCRDSCVELFFTPGPDIGEGYFNFEFNCCGKMLAAHQVVPATDIRHLAEHHCRAVKIVRSLDADTIDPEITAPTTWTLAARIPFDMLANYATVVRPAAGVKWLANAYKCADNTSGPHWLTWAPIDWDGPNFHLPEFFGELVFE